MTLPRNGHDQHEQNQRPMRVSGPERAWQPSVVLAPASFVVVILLAWRITARRRKPLYRPNLGSHEAQAGSRLHSPTLYNRNGVKEPKQPEFVTLKMRRLQAVFDIDDTIRSSGNYHLFGYALGGVDSLYGRGCIYPGVAQFALELSKHALPPNETLAPVAVLTARAKELGPALKLRRHHEVVRAFEEVGAANGYPYWGVGWDKGCVLYGSIAEWVQAERRGLRKYNNFKDTLTKSVHPDVGGTERNMYVLVGDTGEMDLHCGELMLKNHPEDVLAVFMHCVASDQTSVETPHDQMVGNRPVLFFRTYPGAARKAYLNGLMSAAAMLRVCDSALEELVRIEQQHEASGKWTDLTRDIDLCKVVLQSTPEPTSVEA